MAKKPVAIGATQNTSVPGQGKTAVTKMNLNLPSFTEKFQSAFDKCQLQEIFLELVNRFVLSPFIELKTRALRRREWVMV